MIPSIWVGQLSFQSWRSCYPFCFLSTVFMNYQWLPGKIQSHSDQAIPKVLKVWTLFTYSLSKTFGTFPEVIKWLVTWVYIYIYIWWPPPPPKKKNLCFQQKQWYLQCFTHILACRFWKLFLGGSHILIIYKIYMTCKEETLKIQLSSSSCPILPQNRKTEKLKNWIHMENLFLDLSGKFSFSVFLSLSFSANIPTWLRKCSRIVP